MYHRIANPESDVWEITVTPERFEEQLQVLQKLGNVVPLQQLVNGLKSGRLPKNSIAITFDDGYIDNFTVAKPLLEKYGLPATFFITSMNIGSEKEFWWDELEHLILFAEKLPKDFSLTINDQQIAIDLKEETTLTGELRQKHHNWIAGVEAYPTARAELFYLVWEQLRLLPYAEQQEQLQNIRNWADTPGITRPGYRTMSAAELKLLASNDLFTIGAHTLTHPALASYPFSFQNKELSENRKILRELTSQDVDLLSYPFGNYNNDTIAITRDTGFAAAFTTEEKTIKSTSPKYTLGRFQVKNITGTQFKSDLKRWGSH